MLAHIALLSLTPHLRLEADRLPSYFHRRISSPPPVVPRFVEATNSSRADLMAVLALRESGIHVFLILVNPSSVHSLVECRWLEPVGKTEKRKALQELRAWHFEVYAKRLALCVGTAPDVEAWRG